MHRLAVLCLCLFLSGSLFGQDGHYLAGGRSAGMAGTSLTLADAYSTLNNPGSLGRVSTSSAFAGYQNRYGINDLQSFTGGFVYAKPWATSAFSYYRFGGDLFNQQRMSFAIGNQIQLVSLGLGVSLLQYQVEGLKTIHRTAIEFGGQAQLVPQLVFAAHLFNFRQRTYVPTVMRAGLSYRPTEKWMLNAEAEKDLALPEVFRMGMEYQLLKPLAFRTGFSNHPFKSTFGFGLNWNAFQFDYGLTNSQLGSKHDVSLIYQLSDK